MLSPAYFAERPLPLCLLFRFDDGPEKYAYWCIYYPIGLASPTAMNSLAQAAAQALHLVADADPKLLDIVFLSLRVSLAAIAIACVVGLPVGAAIAVNRFPGRRGVVVVLNALMGLPPVVVGLAVYLVLSRAGPFGALGLLFTPTAMVIAQTILIRRSSPILMETERPTLS